MSPDHGPRPLDRDPISKLAGLYESLGRMDDYIKVSQRILKLRPGDSRVRLNLARTLMRQVRFDEAEIVLVEAPSGAADWEHRFLRARLSVHRGDLAGAAAGYREALALKPDALEVYFYLAEALMRLGRTVEMRPALLEARRVCAAPSDGDLRGWTDRFRLALLLCDFKSAFEIGDFILDRSRRLEHVEKLRWPAIIEEYDFASASPEYHEQALAELDRLKRAKPKGPWTSYYRIILFRAYAAGQLRDDTESFLADDHAKVERSAGDRYGWMLMETAKKRLYAGELSEALRFLRTVVRSTDPGSWLAQCMVGETLVCQGEIPEAFAAFAEAEKLAGEFERGNVLAWKGEMHLWLGEYPEALAALDAALPRAAQYAHCWKGGALVCSGRFEEALIVLDRAVAISPWDLEAKIWRAEALLRLGRHAEALEQLRLPPGERESPNLYWHVLRGLVLRALGDSDGLGEEYATVANAGGGRAEYARKRLGLARADSEEEKASVLKSILTFSRGLRRGEEYSCAAWMTR